MLLVSICKILMQFSSFLWTGLHFIGSNFVSTSDERQYTPIGFDVIFPGMIEYAENMGLNLPLNRVFGTKIVSCQAIWELSIGFQTCIPKTC